MYKYILAAVLVASASTAMAAQEFYVAQDPKKKGCEIEHQKPDGVAKIMIGTASYATRAEAKAAKRAAPECNVPDSKK